MASDHVGDREREMAAIRDRKGPVREVPRRGDPDRCLGPASRETFTRWLTPIEEHFVLHRGETPELPADWTVSLRGATTDVDLSVDDLREFPAVSVAHTMECAGNCRAYFDPGIESVAWEFGGASTALWTGAPLEAVFDAHGLRTDDDLWVTGIGADEQERPTDVFARSIPMEKALEDCVLAYEMNGRPLPPEHGFPVRLLVPGWYGVNSVKWLDEIRVMDGMVTAETTFEDRDDDSYYARWQQDRYRIFGADEEPTHRTTVPVIDTQAQLAADDDAVAHPYTFDQTVMSLIGSPSGEEPVTPRADGTVEVVGVAWAGDDAVDRVEVSTDGGETWAEATFVGPAYPNAWRLFRYPWRPEPGEYALRSRATDERGRTQPETLGDPDGNADHDVPWNRFGYGANASEPLGVSVEVVGR
jgi:DMSO/TMAO reductase YedYZ molybdopterin-dependent catalytic subunit